MEHTVLKLKTKLILFFLFSAILLSSSYIYTVKKYFYYDEENYDYIFENISNYSLMGNYYLQREMYYTLISKINSDGLYMYDKKDEEMQEFMESELNEYISNSIDSNAYEVKVQLYGGIYNEASYILENNLYPEKKDAFRRITDTVNDYISKKENGYFKTQNINEIISYYKNISNELISFNKEIQMLPEDNQTRLLIGDYIDLMALTSDAVVEYTSSTYLLYYKKYNKDIYDDFVNAVESKDKYIDLFMEKLNTYGSNINLLTDKLNEIKGGYFVKDYREYILEQYKDGNSPAKEEYYQFLRDYPNEISKYFDILFRICESYKFSVNYNKIDSTYIEENILVSYSLPYIFEYTLAALIIYIIFAVIGIINLFIYIMNIKKVEKYIENTYYANKDLSIDASVLFGDKIGNIGKTIINLTSPIKQLIDKKENNTV